MMASLHDAARYLISCSPSPYVIWYGGDVSSGDGPPAWGVNAPVPDAATVRARGGFCAAVPSLVLRYLGQEIPNPYDDERYDGGIVSYWAAYYDRSEWFDLDADYPDGTLVMSPYNSEAVGDQGHVGMVWNYQGTPYVIEWILSDGLTWNYTLEESNRWGNYQIAIRPEKWLPLDDGVAPDKQPLTPELLVAAMPDLPLERARARFPHLVAAFQEYEINTKARIAAYLAQSGHETASWYYMRQIDRSIGYYYGRGDLQLTHEENYANFGRTVGLDLVSDAEPVADDPRLATLSGAWFWRNGNGDLNPYADQGTWEAFDEITLRVNGGWNGKADRDARYTRAWDALPEGLTLKGEPVDPTEPTGGELWIRYGWYGYASADSWDLIFFPPEGRTTPVAPTATWRKAKERKPDVVKFREVNGEIEVREEDGSLLTYSREQFSELYEEVKE